MIIDNSYSSKEYNINKILTSIDTSITIEGKRKINMAHPKVKVKELLISYSYHIILQIA